MESKSEQTLMKTAKANLAKIKKIQQHCKENAINLESILSKEELKAYRQDLAFMKQYLPEIKADFIALETDPIEDIEKTSFVTALIQWKTIIKKTFLELSKEYKGVRLDINNFGASLTPIAIPIVDDLFNDWKSLLQTLPNDSINAEIVFAKLSESKLVESFTIENEKELLKIYKKAQNKYKELQNDIKKFQTDVLPNKTLFVDAIKASSNPNDENLPENIIKTEKADKTKAGTYQKVLNAWKAAEVANLSYESGDDTTYVDMSMINIGDPKVSIHNLPIELKSNLLRAILDEAKKMGMRKASVKDLKNIAIDAVTAFHRDNINATQNYASLSLEEILAMNFPTNIAGWILNYQVPTEDKNSNIKEYAFMLENWRASERASLDSSNASEHIIIDPAALKINSKFIYHAGIPDELRNNFLMAIKTELLQIEKQEGSLNFNQAAGLARNQIDIFAKKYNVDNTIFDYKQLSEEDIRQLQFPSGVHTWIKEAIVVGNKKDIKEKIKTQLDITLKNTNNFNLEALIKELKIDMGGITINNDFNFDNDLNLTYNNLKLILDELIEINKPKKAKKKKKHTSTTASDILMKGFKVTYYKGCHYELDLKLNLEEKRDSNDLSTLSIGTTMETLNDTGSVLTYYKNHLEKIESIHLEKGKKTVVKVDFSISYKYNQGLKVVKKRDSGYTVTELGGGAGAKVSLRFVELAVGADAKYTVVSGSNNEEVHEKSADITFTDYYTFGLQIENTENGIKVGIAKDISFANKNYGRIVPQYDESVQLCGPIEID